MIQISLAFAVHICLTHNLIFPQDSPTPASLGEHLMLVSEKHPNIFQLWLSLVMSTVPEATYELHQSYGTPRSLGLEAASLLGKGLEICLQVTF